ncbi:MAG TPA: SnoaL-like domain-containing protein, partial [Puia sp.]|nr:SnoaL-like domain-containing protein [Puia sp.]
MTTQKVADRFIELARQGKIEDILKEQYSSDAVSIEPDASMGPKVVEGLPGLMKKSEMFNSVVEEFHGAKISDP